MNPYDVKILVDCDGVLLNWSYGFNEWMKRKGYRLYDESSYDLSKRYALRSSITTQMVEYFNESAAIGYLPPLRDAIKYIKKLKEEHGIIFEVISSFSKDPLSHKLRVQNLKKHFGKGTFEKYHFIGNDGDKTNILKQHENSYMFWIEDKPQNALLGKDLGLQPLLVEHTHNEEYRKLHPEGSKEHIPGFRYWRDFYYTYYG